MQEKRKNSREYRKRMLAFCMAFMLCLTGISDYVISRAEDDSKQNVALKSNGTSIFIDKPHDWAEKNGRSIENMIDGNLETFGQGNTGNDENARINLTLEFKQAYKVDSVVLYGLGSKGFPVDFTVSAYTRDGWTAVANKKGFTYQDGGNTVAFEPVDCMGVRLTVTKNGVDGELGGQFYLKELQVYGVGSDAVILRENAAAAAHGAKISYDRGTEDISKMIDGVTAGEIPNLGIIGAENNETLATDITVEFGGSYHIDTVRLYGDSRKYCFPKDFTIDAFSGGEWQTVCTVTDAEPVRDCNDYPFEEIDCTAIRLHITKNRKDETIIDREAYGIYLSELEVWGMAISDNIALASKGTIASTSDLNEWAEGNDEYGNPVGHGIANVNDGLAGDDQKFFMTAMNPEYQHKVMKVFLAFPKTYEVDKVGLQTSKYKVFPENFEIRAYTASGWQTVVTETGYSPKEGMNYFEFDPVDCSAVALVTTKNRSAKGENDTMEYGIHLSEFEVYGKRALTEVPSPDMRRFNVALASNGTKASTDHRNEWAEGGSNPDGTPVGCGIANLNDGKTDKTFMTTTDPGYENENMKVLLEFPETYRVDTVRLYKWEGATLPVDFEIQAYTASGWQTVVTETGYDTKGGWNDFQFSAVDCSKVRLVTTKNGMETGSNRFGVFIKEFEVYGIKIPFNVALAENGTTAITSHPNQWAEGKDGSGLPIDYGIANVNDGFAGNEYHFFMTAMNPAYKDAEMKVFLMFEKTYQVDKIRLHPGRDGAFPVSFEIRAYTASGWQTVVKKTGYAASGGWNEFQFTPVDCRAVALVTTENGRATDGNYGIMLSEFEVYGIEAETTVNVALASNGTKASTSHLNDWAEKEGYGIVNVNDGCEETSSGQYYFMTGMETDYQNEEMTVILTFDKTYQVDRVRLHPGRDGAFPVSFEIRAYTASGWQTVVRKRDYPAETGWNEFRFTPSDCTAVALVTTENGQATDGKYGIMLSEFEVYGIDAETTVSVPNLNEERISDVEAMIERLDVTANGKENAINDILYWCEAIGSEKIVNYGQFISKTAKQDPLIKPYSKEEYEKLKRDDKAPTIDGYVFTGWFTNSEVVLEENMMQYALRTDVDLSGIDCVYARFVGETMLDVKAQLSVNSSAESQTANIRFLTSVDNRAYSKIGFKIEINGKVKYTANNTVYKQLNDTYINGVKKIIKPDFFHKNAKYFKAATINHIPKTMYDTNIAVIPYLITLDGTVVEGKAVVKTVNQGIVANGRNGVVYYVDADASGEGFQGTTPEQPLKTLEQVNSLKLNPGDVVLFKTNCSWSGQLRLQYSGTKEFPIVYGMYGEEGRKPHIAGDGKVGAPISGEDVSFVEIYNLEVSNKGDMSRYHRGISILAVHESVEGITIKDCYVHDVDSYYKSDMMQDNTDGIPGAYKDPHWNGGIIVRARSSENLDNDDIILKDILIESNEVDRCSLLGIAAGGVIDRKTSKKCEGMVIRGNRVSHCWGDGIILFNSKGGLVEHNVAANNGRSDEGTKAVYVGIWIIWSDDCVIQYNESYGQGLSGDAQGFDIDGECNRTLLQYNYSHDNAGGFLLCMQHYNGKATIRYNVSINDSGAFLTFGMVGARRDDAMRNGLELDVYNNTYFTTKPDTQSVAYDLINYELREDIYARFRNNIFCVKNGTEAKFSPIDALKLMQFENNCYYGFSESTLPNGDVNRKIGDPMFTSEGTGGEGFGTLDGYKLRAGSPCLGSGMTIYNNGGFDFWGNPIATAQTMNIGAYIGKASK